MSIRYRRVKKSVGLLLFIFLAFILIMQCQPLLLNAIGAIDGSFGVRRISHHCLGLTLNDESVARILPRGDVEFHFLLFHFRYAVNPTESSTNRAYCLGQDVWYGE